MFMSFPLPASVTVRNAWRKPHIVQSRPPTMLIAISDSQRALDLGNSYFPWL